MTAIEVKELSYRYHDGTTALKDISFRLENGRKLAILGANGSGKTTLLMHLNGLLGTQSGSVEIFGEAITGKNLRAIRKKVGILFDNPDNQLFSGTVFEDIAFGPFNLGYERAEIVRLTEEAVSALGIESIAQKPPHNLSLGQKKKAAIAGLLSMDPEIFVMDEPFSGLDYRSVEEFLGILEKLHTRGHTLAISTHNVDLAYSWADEILIIGGGRILAGGGHEILHDHELMAESRLNVPTLPRIFEGTGFQPRNIEEAKRLLEK